MVIVSRLVTASAISEGAVLLRAAWRMNSRLAGLRPRNPPSRVGAITIRDVIGEEG